MFNVDQYEYIKKNLKISFFLYLTIVLFPIGIYFQFVAFKLFLQLNLEEFSDGKKVKFLIFLGFFYLSIFLNFLIISKIDNYIYSIEIKIKDKYQNLKNKFDKLNNEILSKYKDKRNEIQNNINIVKSNLRKLSNVILNLSNEIYSLDNKQINMNKHNEYLKELVNIESEIKDRKQKINLSDLNNNKLETIYEDLKKYEEINKNKIFNLNKIIFFENIKNEILNFMLKIINDQTKFTIIKITDKNLDISISNKNNVNYYMLNNQEKTLIKSELTFLFQKLNNSYFPIIFIDGNIVFNNTSILEQFKSKLIYQVFLLNISNSNQDIFHLNKLINNKTKLNQNINKISRKLEISFAENKTKIETEIKRFNQEIETLNNSIKNKENYILEIENKILSTECINKMENNKIKILSEIEKTKFNIQSSDTKIEEIEKSKKNLEDFEIQNKVYLQKNRKILLLKQIWNKCLIEITSFVNSKTKRTRVEIINNKNISNKVENYFAITSKITYKSFYNMNNAERWMVGFELANLFQDFNKSYFPIIFDNAEVLDKNNQKNIVDNFFKIYINRNKNIEHQLFLLNVTNGTLNITKENYLIDKVMTE